MSDHDSGFRPRAIAVLTLKIAAVVMLAGLALRWLVNFWEWLKGR